MSVTYTNRTEPLRVPRMQRCSRIMIDRGNPPSTSFSTFSIGQTEQLVTGGVQRILAESSDWRSLIALGKDAGTDYKNVGCTFKPKITRIQTDARYNQFVTSHSDVAGTFLVDPWVVVQNSDDFSLQDLAVKRLKTKIASRGKSINVLVPIAELREFKGMIAAVGFAGLDIARALLEIKRTKGKSAYQYAAHAWLNWSFAISPTLSDIQSLAEKISYDLNNTQGKRYIEHGVAKKLWASSTTFTHASSYDGNSKLVATVEHSLSYRVVCGFKTKIRSANDYSVAASYGLEFGALVPTLWELTAFSWLFDYFSTIGDYLEDTFITDQTVPVYCSVTKKYTADIKYWVGPSQGFGIYNSVVKSKGPSEARFFDIRRSALSAPPPRILRLKTIDEIGKGAVNKLLNLASIVIGGKASVSSRV